MGPGGVHSGQESAALRGLRLLERELFGAGAVALPSDYESDCTLGSPGDLSAAPPPPYVEHAEGRKDLSWLVGLDLPGIPVRWDARVIDYLVFFKEHPRGRNIMAGWLRRTEVHGAMIRRVLAEHGLPADIEYVAMAESGFDASARSKAGAVGLWQFMKRTGKHYGLRVDHWVDQRRAPEAASHAAARFLSELHRRFDSWELALAAYNMGYGGLLRSIRKYNTNDYWLLSNLEAGLPFETRMYVAKITAAAIIGRNRARFGFANLAMLPAQQTEVIKVPAGTPLGRIARFAGVELETLQTLNADLLRKRIPPDEEDRDVHLPVGARERFAVRWNRSQLPLQNIPYTVRFGETLEDIARTRGISTARLRKLNAFSSVQKALAGMALLVPARGRTRALPEAPPVVTIPDREFVYEGRRRVFYRIGKNDRLADIARFFHVNEQEVVEWNHLRADAALQRGQMLQLFIAPELDLGKAVVLAPSEVRVLVLGSEAFFDYHESQRGRVRLRYIVQPGDTLKSIGKAFDLSVGSLGRINDFARGTTLNPGQQIVVYVPEDSARGLLESGRGVRPDNNTLQEPEQDDRGQNAPSDSARSGESPNDGRHASATKP